MKQAARNITSMTMGAFIALIMVIGMVLIGAMALAERPVYRVKSYIASKAHPGPARLANGLEVGEGDISRTDERGVSFMNFRGRELAVPAGGATPATALTAMNIYNVAPNGLIAANEDIFAGNPATDVLSMANYSEIIFIITKNAGATGTATITVESCDDVTPSTATAVAFKYTVTTTGNTIGAVTDAAAAGFATTAGANQIYAISVRDTGLSGTNKYVRMQMTEVVDSPCDGAVIAIGLYPRYPQDVPQQFIT